MAKKITSAGVVRIRRVNASRYDFFAQSFKRTPDYVYCTFEVKPEVDDHFPVFEKYTRPESNQRLVAIRHDKEGAMLRAYMLAKEAATKYSREHNFQLIDETPLGNRKRIQRALDAL